MFGTARGVSLGLGKLNLADLSSSSQKRDDYLKAREKRVKSRHKILTKKCFHIETLWVACRAIIFGVVIITLGILMSVLGYFYIYLSQEIVYNWDGSIGKTYTNWTKRYLLKSLQYLGPIAMSIGSLVLIGACVITLEHRDKNAEMLHKLEIDESKQKSLSQRDVILKHSPMTDKEIHEWTPQYKIVPSTKCDSSPIERKYRSTPCIPQIFHDDIENRNSCGRYHDSHHRRIVENENDQQDNGRVCTSKNKHCNNISHWQDVTVELHSPPSTLLSSTIRKIDGRTSNEDNIVVTIDPVVTSTSNTSTSVDVTLIDGTNCKVLEECEIHAPLASLDIEFGISSSSSSSNLKVPSLNNFHSNMS